jgi:hypothetical protein
VARLKKELAAWLPSTPLESISFDVREGGRYRYTMVNVETSEEYPTGGVFLDVVPFERLVLTWGSPDDPIENSPVVTLTLTAQGDRTEMIFHLRGLAGHPGDKYFYDGCSQDAYGGIGQVPPTDRGGGCDVPPTVLVDLGIGCPIKKPENLYSEIPKHLDLTFLILILSTSSFPRKKQELHLVLLFA